MGVEENFLPHNAGEGKGTRKGRGKGVIISKSQYPQGALLLKALDTSAESRCL
jgi:hypothetical protein